MVSFELKEVNDSTAVYWYYPENDKETGYGILALDKKNGYVSITKMAPNDFSRVVSIEELNSLRNSVIDMRKENGEPELTEEEWPSSTKPEVSTFYADHVMKKLVDAFKNGTLLESGSAIWF